MAPRYERKLRLCRGTESDQASSEVMQFSLSVNTMFIIRAVRVGRAKVRSKQTSRLDFEFSFPLLFALFRLVFQERLCGGS